MGVYIGDVCVCVFCLIRWMKKKREEKRDEISRRLLYRKLYFSQEQELRLSQSRRYAVQ